MTPGEQAVYEALMRANEADAAMSDDEHPGCMLGGLVQAALPRWIGQATDDPSKIATAPTPPPPVEPGAA